MWGTREKSLDWTAGHVPSANVVATATQAAPGVGKYNVCLGLTVVLAAGASAPSAINVTVRLIDGAAGGTTYLWQATMSLPATAGAMSGISRPMVDIRGSVNTAMTLEFSAAGGTNTIESVSMEGTVGV